MHALSGSGLEIGITPKSQEAANQMVEIIFWCPGCDDILEVAYCNSASTWLKMVLVM
jgi:hypothetical protein